MLRILHVITGLGRGGAEAVLSRVVAATQADFRHVVVALRDRGHYAPILEAQGIRVHALGMNYGMSIPAKVKQLASIMRDERPDIVQTWMYHADLIGGAAARLASVRPVLWGIRNTNLSALAIRRSTRIIAWLGARLSSFVPDAIVCNSHESARVHAAFGYNSQLMRVIPNGYDVTCFRPNTTLRESTRAALGIAREHVLLGMVARWDPQKDHANLLAAIGNVARREPDVRLLLVGDGMERPNLSLMRLVSDAGLDDRVILAGPRNDIPAIMNALDLHVLSSLGESFPNVVAEAMACGTPCATTDVGDAKLIVGETGWVAPPRDAESLAQAVGRAIAAIRHEGRAALGARARARIVENFEISRMTAAYAELWRTSVRAT